MILIFILKLHIQYRIYEYCQYGRHKLIEKKRLVSGRVGDAELFSKNIHIHIVVNERSPGDTFDFDLDFLKKKKPPPPLIVWWVGTESYTHIAHIDFKF